MAKSRRRDRTKDGTHSIWKDVKPLSDPELAAIREAEILPIINDLSSPEPKQRLVAASTIAIITGDGKRRKLLLREQIVRIILEQTIADASLESKSAGWGILSTIAKEEEADFCLHLYRQDILGAIEAATQSILDAVQSHEYLISNLPEAQRIVLWALSNSIIHLISSLAEAQNEILQAISKVPVVLSFMFGLLAVESLPGDLFYETLLCLSTLTEDNQYISQQVADNKLWLNGLGHVSEIGGLSAVAACGVLHNVFSALQWFDHNTPMGGLSDAVLIPKLIKCIDETQTKKNLANSSNYSSPDQILELALEIIASIGTSLQEALEHAGRNEKEFEGFGDDNELSGDAMVDEDGSDIMEEDGDADGNEEMSEEEIDADMELVAGPDQDRDHGSVDGPPTLEALVRIATPAILNLAEGAYENDAVRARTLSALNNISWTVSSIDFATSSKSLHNAWSSLAQRAWSKIVTPVLKSNTADIALAASITSIAWALARSAQGRLSIDLDEQRKFMALYEASKSLPSSVNGKATSASIKTGNENDDDFQGLGVKCIGVLGRLGQSPTPTPLNREIGIFLITVLSALPDTPSADAVEALNQIFDIYADKEYDYDEPVFWGDGFYGHLEAIALKARKMAKTIDKRKHTELRQRADEAVLNLGRFLVYKKKERNES